MTDQNAQPLDVLGIGFGPSNLALAVALHERGSRLRTGFLEAKPAFAWHPDMMLAGTDMQVSFLKDLVSLRNPRSGFSFLSYLHAKGRLSRFINRKTFFPSREEFNDYLGWIAGQFSNCQYDSRVTGLEPVRAGDRVTHLAVHCQSAEGRRTRHLARNIVLAPGGIPHWPETFAPLKGCGRVIHASGYLSQVAPKLKPGQRIAVIGAGQSAAEVFADLAARPEQPRVDLILRGRALKPSDDTPFVNEIFDPAQTDRFYGLPEETRAQTLHSLAATNYAVTDADLIEHIYETLYAQDVRGDNRLGLLAETQVKEAQQAGAQVRLRLSGPSGPRVEAYDLVVLGTGYRRALDQSVLAGLSPWQTAQEPDRDYRLPMKETFEPGIFVQGFSEPTHGLSDTLLSVLALRSDEIARQLENLHGSASAIAAE
ncbi:lysine N(6)-hydroxylase/L-ornithine N(5)-oxygenase family protein [Pseudosulfitobacter sp. DSM 107133]|uniref:lysine N(6)-hydroxylase/L-ornithine N(5)-oxygenase family protein n=1 Tax=Pseudosulfitobacter sp. DSM 107133 TaxID=2883100 RepID=UPI000DF1CBC6|nr:lysine N(6)-hydroxylase/L-ornithine N(5)-oxygenase family protein [Pseudosulfitobacter sp. DSM 107133]UOA29252.1 L-ornithine N(5)-monooxygenase [Pseudosulfitobacter sp. DSM 107133]